jgi:hypothetical protein
LLLLLLLLLLLTPRRCQSMLERSHALLLHLLLHHWRSTAACTRERTLKGLLKLAEDKASHVSQKMRIVTMFIHWRAFAVAAKTKRALAVTYLERQHAIMSSAMASTSAASSAASLSALPFKCDPSSHMRAFREFSAVQALARGSMRNVIITMTTMTAIIMMIMMMMMLLLLMTMMMMTGAVVSAAFTAHPRSCCTGVAPSLPSSTRARPLHSCKTNACTFCRTLVSSDGSGFVLRSPPHAPPCPRLSTHTSSSTRSSCGDKHLYFKPLPGT